MNKGGKMELRVPVNSNTKWIIIMQILDCVQPFKSLRPRELETLAKLLQLTHELKNLTKEQRGLVIFHHTTKEKIAEEFGITIDNFYNILLSLRKKDLIDDYGVVDKIAKPFMEQDITEITFKFVTNA